MIITTMIGDYPTMRSFLERPKKSTKMRCSLPEKSKKSREVSTMIITTNIVDSMIDSSVKPQN